MKTVVFDDQEYQLSDEGNTRDLAGQILGDDYRKVLGGKVKNEIYHLKKSLPYGEAVDFVTIESGEGYRNFQQTVSAVFIMACRELFPEHNVHIQHSLGSGLYAELEGDASFTFKSIELLEKKMQEIIDADYEIDRQKMDASIAYNLFENFNYMDKIRLYQSVDAKKLTVYNIEGHIDTFNGYLAASTGYVNCFKLKYYYPGVLIFFPDKSHSNSIPPYKDLKKLSKIFDETNDWMRILGLSDLGSMNLKLKKGKAEELIRVAEALHEKKIASIADMINKDSDVHLILIAGPSSSGKTTFAERLAMQLKVLGLAPILISADNYFLNRKDTPKNEDGSYDYESLRALDVEALNRDIISLLEGEEVKLPVYNFITGEKEYPENSTRLEKGNMIICEGIHSLNPEMTPLIPNKNKFKVYISALTQLNLDGHNRISTTESRLLRRMIRDNTHRGNPPEKTLEMWNSVRAGEEANIFPYQEEADVMFNSALMYELAVLKKYALPLIQGIDNTSPYFGKMKKIIKFLSYFVDITEEEERHIPRNSLLREFIGFKNI